MFGDDTCSVVNKFYSTMANILGRDPVAYARERDSFLRELHQFHETRGTLFRRTPNVNGHEIDLYLLYTLVTSQGGWLKINSRNEWHDLYKTFNIPENCVNGGVALKQLYLRYLDRWEKVHFLGEEHDRGGDDDEESRHRRWSARALHSVPLSYNHQQHNIADAVREYHNLSTDLYKQSDYDRLVLSLISPLPNEQDFAVNVCTLLSNDGKHTLKLEKHPRLVDHLVAHAGVFNHSSLRKLVTSYYNKIRQHPLDNFWKNVLELEEFLDLSDENNFMKSQTVSIESNYSDSDYSILSSSLIKSDLVTECDQQTRSNCLNNSSDCEIDSDNFSNREIFNLGRTLGTQDYVGQRVLQIATIFRNLSFIEENISVLSQSETFVRFMLLCSCARWGHLHTLGLDMLGNIVGQYEIKDLCSHKLSQCLIKLISMGLQSEDRTYCIASLDALNKLSQIELNEEVLARSLEPHIYKKVCSFLTLHDVMLLVYTLECLYSLTSLGERPCNLIVNIHGVLDTLVSLVTVEGKSYGPKACIGMKLVETIPAGSAASSTATESSTMTTTMTVSSTTASTLTSTTTTTASLPTTPTTSVLTTPQKTVASATSTRSVQRVIVTPASSSTTAVTTTSTTMSPQQIVQQQHAHQQAIQENEQFALAWLRATYEPCHKNRIDHQELYKYYINSCAKIGRRGVIAPLHFPRCVRSVFGGTVGPNPMKPTTANEPQYYEGIKVRAQPLVITIHPASNPSPVLPTPKNNTRRKIQNLVNTPVSTSCNISLNLDSADSLPPSPASPILKAQLSAPSKPKETTVVSPTSKADIKSQVMAHPHLSQALLGSSNTATSAGPSKEPQTGQSNTSLIKSLLATKVNDCMPPISMKTSMDCQTVVQVAARQQQQQQKLISQQNTNNKHSKILDGVSKTARLNGVRQLFVDDVTDSSVSSTTVGSNFSTGKREPPQPPPPPLAPLSNNQNRSTLRIDNEDSNSTGNNSLASSSGINLGVSSTEENDNSLTSFEGLLNGVPSMDSQLLLNDDSNSKDSLKSIGASVICKNKPLMLADLLEKKVDKDPPILNGMLGKELRIGERGLELVENHIEKALNMEKSARKHEDIDVNSIKRGIKRVASEEMEQEVETKKTCISGNVNGSADSPRPDSVSSSSNCDEPTGTVSTAAAKLFADIAADILEDEEEEMLQEAQAQQQIAENTGVVQVIQNNSLQQVYMDQSQQVIVAAQPRQIIMSPSIQTTNQVVLPAGTQIKPGQTVIVQNPSQQRAPMVLQQSNTGQFLLSQGLPGQMQLVPSSTQPGQFVFQTGGAQNAYVVAQSQTAVVHGQPQTLLVAQTSQQQGTGTKTIIILQQPATTPTHHQKVVVTPQGQQVVVTQVPRPILQTASTVSNVIPTNPTVIRAPITTVINQTEKKPPDEVKPVPKIKIVRDVNWPYVCEWDDCQVETKFKSANQVYLHVCEAHCLESIDELTCQWDRCDNMKRKRFSMMTHIYDKHCNVEAMKQSQIKRKQHTQSSNTELATTASATPHPGYAPDAALHAIKRHALEFVNPKELQQRTAKQGTVVVSTSVPRAGPSSTDQDDNEGPVTKSMRLTAALILRNLVIYSNNCKRYLRHYEPHLANVALSNVESSRTVAQILYDMSDGVNNR